MPPTFDKSPPELVARFAELAEQIPDATRKQMFGYPTLTLGGNMFMGLHQDAFILRLAEPDRTEFIDRYQGGPFEPMPGRPMREYVVVPPSLLNDPHLDSWITKSAGYARQLPTKKPKNA